MNKVIELTELFATPRNPDRKVWTTTNQDAEWRGSARVHFRFRGKFVVVMPTGVQPVPNCVTSTELSEEFAAEALESFQARGQAVLDAYQKTGHSHYLDSARHFAGIVQALVN